MVCELLCAAPLRINRSSLALLWPAEKAARSCPLFAGVRRDTIVVRTSIFPQVGSEEWSEDGVRPA